MPALPLQNYLFQCIRQKLSPDESLAEVVAGILHQSYDSAYRRIRGETALVLEEARTLCHHFSISLDDVLEKEKDSVSFRYNKIDNQFNDFDGYLDGIIKSLQHAEGGELLYLAKDVPVFYNFLFKPVFAFRYFFWMKSITMHPEFIHRKFTPDCITDSMLNKAEKIARLYTDIPSIEIWNTECINSTISQIEYYRDAGYFQSAADIRKIYETLFQLIDHLKQQAEAGAKFLPGEKLSAKKNNYQFFYNRLVLGENTIIVKKGNQLYTYLACNVLNYLVTNEPDFCADTLAKTENLMRRSTLLSLSNDKQRNIFFNLLLKKIPGPTPIKEIS